MIEFPPFRLDLVNQCLWRRDDSGRETRIEMTPKAYSMLRYLAERAGRLVTQEELLSALWPQAYVQPEVLKSHVLSIRHALGDNPKSPRYIETLPRRGYRFVATIGSDRESESSAQGLPGLVGRRAPLQELRRRLQSAVDGHRQIVFVTGEPGIGKSALVDEFKNRAIVDWSGLRVAVGQCVEGYGGKEPYYPVLEAIGKLCRQPGGEAIVEMLVDKAPTWLVQFPALLKAEHRAKLQLEIMGATRERMLREIAEAFEELSAKAPLLLVLSDLHWVDPATVDLIATLARHGSSARLMVVCTYRPADLALTDHPLKGVKQDLMAHRLCSEIALQRLQQDDVALFLHPTDSNAAGEHLPKLIHKLSDGNPLFMMALLNHMVSRGLAKRDLKGWQLQLPVSEFDVGVPEGIRQMIELRIERLSEVEQRALEAASVLGVTFEPEAGAAAAAMRIEEFEDICDRLARKRDVLRTKDEDAVDDGHQYQFVHSLYRDVFYKRQPHSRRARIHLRCGDWMELNAGSSASDEASILAYHFEAAASWERALKYLRMSAEIAINRYAPREAESLLRHALDVVERLPAPQSQAIEIDLLQSLCLIYESAMDARALEAFETLAAKAAEYGLLEQQFWALHGLLTHASVFGDDRVAEIQRREFELASQIHDRQERVLALATHHVSEMVRHGWSKGDEVECSKWVQQVRDEGDGAKLVPLLLSQSWILVHLSRYREGLAVAEEALAGCVARPHLYDFGWGAATKNLALFCLGDWGRALQWMEEVATAGRRNGYPMRASASLLMRARICTHAGDYSGAVQVLNEVLPQFQDAKVVPHTRGGQALLGCAMIGLGEIGQGLRILRGVDEDMARQLVPYDRYLRPEIEWGFVEAYMESGDVQSAERHLKRLVDSAEQLGEVTWQGLAWEAGARLALARNDAEEASERLSTALNLIEGYEVPLASWKIHACFAEAEEILGHRSVAARLRRGSAATIQALAGSLPAADPIREAFLSSSRVRSVLESR